MSSLYNMLHGYEPTAQFVLDLLNVQPSAIPRFRDAYVTYRDPDNHAGGVVMVLLTRTGGSNRDDYVNDNESLRLLRGYIDDIDDSFDSTFALFRYAVPVSVEDTVIKHLTTKGMPLTLQEKTEQAIGPDQTPRQKQASKDLVEQISKMLQK